MLNIYQRIRNVMQEVQYLKKDDYVQTAVSAKGNKKGYYALTAEKVISAIRPCLVKHGIAIIPTSYEIRRSDESLIGFDGKPRPNRLTEITATYRIQNVDDPSDYVMAVSIGQGADAQDKGCGKAMTYSYKYLLTTLFAIASGEDPDKIASDEYTDDLLSSYAPQEPEEADTEERRDTLQETIIALIRAQGREDADADAAAREAYGRSLYELTAAELVQIKIKIAKGQK